MDQNSGDSIQRSLAIVDLENFDFDDAGAGRVAQRLGEAFVRNGFCYIENTGVSAEILDDIILVAQEFHALPMEAKKALAINEYHRGYLAPKTSIIVTSTVDKVTKPNNSESILFMHEVPENDPRFGGPLQGPNQWPDQLPDFRMRVTRYMETLQVLGRRLTALIARALGLGDNALDPLFEKPTEFLRLLHYPPQERREHDEFGSAPHTDYGFITILLQDGIGGLEVLGNQGEWIPATPIPGTFVVNVGDILSRLTNGKWKATPHRVTNSNLKDRYSTPYFFDPDMQAMIRPLIAGNSGDAGAEFPDVLYGTYLMERINKNYQYREVT